MILTQGTFENYTCSKAGLLLPVCNEFTWSVHIRAFLYLVGLLYCFFGISIVADIFMSSIERITSVTKTIVLSDVAEDRPEVLEVRIWNETVANLTLMALGSSAPEILLSVIEIIGNNFEAGDLGPGTIVGSAAFNLLCISAVCVVSLPCGETKNIQAFKVFIVTSSFSIFAYLWLLFILSGTSPDVVEIWEAATTFLFFPILVIFAFVMDKNVCWKDGGDKEEKQIELDGIASNIPGNSLACILKMLSEVSDSSQLIFHIHMRKTPGWMLIEPRKKATWPTASQEESHCNVVREKDTSDGRTSSKTEEHSVVEFQNVLCSVPENIGVFFVSVRRSGKMNAAVSVRLHSIDGTAVAGEDYVPIDEVISFRPFQVEHKVPVQIVDDLLHETDEEFFIKLSILPDGNSDTIRLGPKSVMEVTIIDNDEPGVLKFKKRAFLVKENAGVVTIPVLRTRGSDGEVAVKWRTKDRSAIGGKDYVITEGTLTFKNRECQMNIEIPIKDDFEAERNERFEVELYDPTNGAKLGSINRTVVTIVNDDEFNSLLNQLILKTHANMDRFRLYHENWADQIKAAITVNGNDVENATVLDYILHVVLFSLIPPVSILGGWLSFCISLICIGILTAIVGDLASIFGCLIGLEDSITGNILKAVLLQKSISSLAITLVAMGTSLPDLFASRSASLQEKHADNAIGNITGSNSVNVFLGLGLPWMIAAVYHSINHSTFTVQAGTLGFNVAVYVVCGCLGLGLLLLRRSKNFFGSAELGGPYLPKIFSALFLFSLWIIYVVTAILQSYDLIGIF